ncbi:MAG: ATP-binding protein [Ignavibacteriales bacterium]|nr:ATP-binding protein [Ignavibacteriales bacterium]
MFKRNLVQKIKESLEDTPVLFISGARQTGKSTLIKSLVSSAYSAEYITFDESSMLSAAKTDPEGFIKRLPKPVALDEVQRVPELFLAIKADVDRVRTHGRYILTGSANVLLLPKIADSLAGRMEILTLWTLSQNELHESGETFVDKIFSGNPLPTRYTSLHRSDIMEMLVKGGYPEVLSRKNEERRRTWFGSYITTILQRDVRDLARIEGLTVLPRLLSLLAARTSTLFNLAEVSNSSNIPQTSLKRYLSLLETTYLITYLPAWASNLGKRLIKTPKLLLCDTGIAAHLIGVSASELAQQSHAFGQLLESFVTMELTKQITWSETDAELFHFRTLRSQEVDLVLEDRSHRVVGIEVKAGATVTASDFKNIRIFAEIAGEKFHLGIVLYTGTEVIPFGENLFAVPVNALWL